MFDYLILGILPVAFEIQTISVYVLGIQCCVCAHPHAVAAAACRQKKKVGLPYHYGMAPWLIEQLMREGGKLHSESSPGQLQMH